MNRLTAKTIIKITTPEITTSGPGSILSAPDSAIPEIAEMAPNIALKMKYLERLALTILAAAAGVTTKKPTSNVPVTWMPIATVTETRRR